MAHEEERPGNQETEIDRKQGSFAMHCIDDSSRWSLHCDPDEAAESQHITNTACIPSTRSKVGSQEGTETSLHVGEKEIQPFERPHTPLSSWSCMAHRVSPAVSQRTPFAHSNCWHCKEFL